MELIFYGKGKSIREVEVYLHFFKKIFWFFEVHFYKSIPKLLKVRKSSSS